MEVQVQTQIDAEIRRVFGLHPALDSGSGSRKTGPKLLKDEDWRQPGGPITKLHRLGQVMAMHISELVTDMLSFGAPQPFLKRFKRESFGIPLGILKGLLILSADPFRSLRELGEVKESLRIVQAMLKSTREGLCAPQEKVAVLLEEVAVAQDLIDAVIRMYGAPICLRS